MRVLHGNATERKDNGKGLRQSSLFFLTAYYLKNSLFKDRVLRPEELSTFARFSAPLTPFKNPREGIILTLGRTYNRSRSLR